MGKHSAEIHTDKIKGTGKVKGVIVLTLCICILLVITIYIFNKLKEKQPEDVINNFFTSIKENDSQYANKFSNYEDLLDSLDSMLLEDDSQTSKVKNQLFKNINWSIEDVEIEEDRAIVIVEATNKNFKNIITKWMKELVVSKSLGKEVTNQLALEKLEKVLLQESEYKTVIKKITLNNNGENWKIQVNQELRDLVYPGIDSVIEVLNSNIDEN